MLRRGGDKGNGVSVGHLNFNVTYDASTTYSYVGLSNMLFRGGDNRYGVTDGLWKFGVDNVASATYDTFGFSCSVVEIMVMEFIVDLLDSILSILFPLPMLASD